MPDLSDLTSSPTLATLDPATWPFGLEWLPETACLVGGAVRDSLLQRQREYLDLDFVLPKQAIETARRIAQAYHAGFVVLDAQRSIARVVFEKATADFAQQEGETLEVDLRRRDFTINAIAYHPLSRTLIDPLQGCQDLERQLIRMVSPQNLADDPLRLLRAYRQSAQLGFTIEPETHKTLIALAPQLGRVAPERVRMELGYLLNLSTGSEALIAAWRDGVLKVWFAQTTAARMAQLRTIDAVAELLRSHFPSLEPCLHRPLLATQPTTQLSLAKLLLFFSVDPQNAQIQMKQLKLSRPEIRAAIATLQHLPHFVKYHSTLSLRQQYFFFQHAQFVFPALVVLALVEGVSLEAIAPLIERYLNPDDPLVYPRPLITGNLLIERLVLPKGKLIGILLTEIHIAHIEGKVNTPDEAIAFAQQWLIRNR